MYNPLICFFLFALRRTTYEIPFRYWSSSVHWSPHAYDLNAQNTWFSVTLEAPNLVGVIIRVIARVQRFTFVWTNICIHPTNLWVGRLCWSIQNKSLNNVWWRYYHIPATSLLEHITRYWIVFYTRKGHFDTAFLPMFFLSMPVGHIATTRDLGNAVETKR